jgi:hypothetical protein
MGTSLGDSTNLGFMKGLPATVASGHSSGSGLSGLIGTSFYLLLKVFDFPFHVVVSSMLFFYPLYVLNFHLAVRLKRELRQIQHQPGRGEDRTGFVNLSTSLSVESSRLDLKFIERQESEVNENISWALFKEVLPKSYSYITAYYTLYLLEYMANSWLTSIIVRNYSNSPRYDPNSFSLKYGFECALVIYRLGMFLGRSSLSLFKVKNYWTLLILLFFLVGFHFMLALDNDFLPYSFMFRNIFLIAFVGGVIFCNCISSALGDSTLLESEREATINLLAIMGDGGVLTSSVLGLFIPCLIF